MQSARIPQDFERELEFALKFKILDCELQLS